MQQALDYVMYIYNKFINFIFNEASLFTDITIGWVVFACLVFWMLMKSILNMPRSMMPWSVNKYSERARLMGGKGSSGERMSVKEFYKRGYHF